MKVTNIYLPEDVHTRVRHLAVDRKTTMADLIRQAIDAWLQRQYSGQEPQKEKTMATFEHEVPEDVRNASKWDDEYMCYVAPNGRSWRYSNDPASQGASWVGDDGKPISVAVWLVETDDEPA